MTLPPPETDQNFAFSTSAIYACALKLVAARPIAAGQSVTALIAGIAIGESSIARGLQAGEELLIFCTSFPKVVLPAEIRFALQGDDHDAAPALVISTEQEVLSLVPSSPLQECSLGISAGRLVGHGIEPMNAMVAPHMACRINGVLLRAVKVEAVVPRPNGGAIVRFSCEIQPGDLVETGVHYEIMTLPNMVVIASLFLDGIRTDGQSQRVLSDLQSKLDQNCRKTSYEIAQLAALIETRHQKAMTLIDGMAQYMLAAVYDSLAQDSAPSPAADRALATFRQLVAEQERQSEKALPNLPPQQSVSLALTDLTLHHGWHAVEQWAPGVNCLWMSDYALLRNPWPDAPLLSLSLQLMGIFSEEVLPMTVLFDGLAADVELIRNGAGRSVRITAKMPQGVARQVNSIEFLANRALSPKDLGQSEDVRKLSLSVSAASLHYQF